jgi:hypothetical protein
VVASAVADADDYNNAIYSTAMSSNIIHRCGDFAQRNSMPKLLCTTQQELCVGFLHFFDHLLFILSHCVVVILSTPP